MDTKTCDLCGKEINDEYYHVELQHTSKRKFMGCSFPSLPKVRDYCPDCEANRIGIMSKLMEFNKEEVQELYPLFKDKFKQ